MDYVREALIKSKTALAESSVQTKPLPVPGPSFPGLALRPETSAPQERWTPRQVTLDPKLMKRNRIVSFAMTDPGHVAFDLLRTRVLKSMGDNGWKTVAITSPTPGCGKTMVGLNLALTMARVPDCKVVLVDMDLKRPSVAKTLGIQPTASIGQFLMGKADAKDSFVQVNPNLVVGLSNDNIRSSSELIQAPAMGALLEFIQTSLMADIVLFDLPPMGSSDDALAFLPRVDAALLVVAAGMTKVSEIDDCEAQVSQLNKLLGVVMNKSNDQEKVAYY